MPKLVKRHAQNKRHDQVRMKRLKLALSSINRDKEKKKARTQKSRNGELPQPVTAAPEQQCTDADWVTIVTKKTRKKTGDASKPNISNIQPKIC